MNSAVVYRRRDVIADSFIDSGNGGGGLDNDFSRRLGNVESEAARPVAAAFVVQDRRKGEPAPSLKPPALPSNESRIGRWWDSNYPAGLP